MSYLFPRRITITVLSLLSHLAYTPSLKGLEASYPITVSDYNSFSVVNYPWYQCAESLIGTIPIDKPHKLLGKIHSGVLPEFRNDTDFMSKFLALAHVESRFDRTAVSHAGARGIFQLTQSGILEAEKECPTELIRGKKNKLNRDVSDPVVGARYASCYLRRILRKTGGDWVRAAVMYNGGYAQLNKYEAKVNMTAETANYVLKIMTNVNKCGINLK